MVEAFGWAITGCISVVLFLAFTFYVCVIISYWLYLLLKFLNTARKNHKK